MAVDNKTLIFFIYKVYILKTTHSVQAVLFSRVFFVSFMHLIIHNIDYIMHPEIKHFHTIVKFILSIL